MERAFLRRVRIRPAWVVLALCVVGAVALFATDVLRSPRAVVRDALIRITRPADQDLRFLIDVKAKPDPRGKQYHRLHFRAGPGPVTRASGKPLELSFPFQLVRQRKGVTVTVRGSTIIRDRVGYVRLEEMPAYENIGGVLEDRWLQIGEQRDQASPAAVSPQQTVGLLRSFLAKDIVRRIDRGKLERVRHVQARVYHLRVDEDRLRVLLEGPEGQHAAGAGVARYLTEQLRRNHLNRLALWIRPRTHDLVRVRLELVPREKSANVERIVVDATLLPREGGPVPEAPKGAVRLRPETIQAILGRGR